MIGQRNDPKVKLYAPAWLKGLAAELEQYNPFKAIKICETGGRREASYDASKLTPVTIAMLARTQERNKRGFINFGLYGGRRWRGEQKQQLENFIISLRDLVIFTVMVGLTRAKKYGGFPRGGANPVRQHQSPLDVLLVDLIGLQFQNPWNCGRLAIFSNNANWNFGLPLVNERIHKNVVGEDRKGFAEVERLYNQQQDGGRYVLISGNPFDGTQLQGGIKAYFDQKVYQRIVAYQFILSCLALENRAAALGMGGPGILFRFLHYGAGYFAGKNNQVKTLIEENVTKGVELALRCLRKNGCVLPMIKCLQLPYFRVQNNAVIEATLDLIRSHCRALGIATLAKGVSDKIDALAPVIESVWKNFLLAITNAADPHAVLGNEMNYGSVDAMIAENLDDFGNIFSLFLNRVIQYIILDLTPQLVHAEEPNFSRNTQTGGSSVFSVSNSNQSSAGSSSMNSNQSSSNTTRLMRQPG